MRQLPMFDDDKLKRYYSIKEVAEMFGVSKSLIRFWEGEFEHFKPHKNSKGERRFTKENIQQLELIHFLVKNRGFTLDGAKNEIKSSKKRNKEKALLIKQMEKMKKNMEALYNEI